jgi:dihydroflavonol-4-reductase
LADETTPTNEADFIGTYKRSKYLAERAVMDLVRQESLPVVVVNPAATVGPRDIKPTPTGKMIRDAAAGRVPAYIDTGINMVHVDDVAEGHALALERGRIGERYVLGGENLLLKDILALVANVVGRKPPTIELPEALVWPAAWFMEGLARLTGIPPMMTRDHIKMARHKMYYSSAKATRELGYNPRPVRAAVEDAVAWFRANGMLK